MVRGMGDKIYIKSQSFASSTNTLPATSTGYNELIYYMRFASVKSIFAINGSSSNNTNGRFDSLDLTSGGASIHFL